MGTDVDVSRWASSHVVLGAVGSTLALRWAPGLSWWERLTNVIGGAMCAGVLTPAAADWLHLTTDGMREALAFLCGMFAMSLLAAAFGAIRELKLAEIITGWVSRKG